VAGARGVWFWDETGKRYLDFASQLVNANLGHAHPRIVEAIQEQAARLAYVTPTFANDKRGELARRLLEVVPAGLRDGKVFFTTGGAESNEAALQMARLVTGRQKVITRWNSYHGATMGARSAGGDPRRLPLEPGVPGTIRAMDPFCYRCPFGLTYPACHLHCAEPYLRNLIEFEGPDTIAAIMLEPITGSNCRIVPPPEYMPIVRRLCDEYGILLILDEVMTGFGRTGEWFCAEHWGISPDIMTLAKGITGGAVPLGAVVVSRQVAEHFRERILYTGMTYSGHPLACAAGVAAVRAYAEEGWIENSRELGKTLMRELTAMKLRHHAIGDVRGVGLFACIELVTDRATRAPLVPWTVANYEKKHPAVAAVLRQCLAEGLYTYSRWNMIMLAPPLVISDEELGQGLEIIDRALGHADRAVAEATQSTP
jgi:taurine--2-oxoglutarate transaminase